MGGYQQLVHGEPFRGKFRNSFEKPEPFVPGQPATIKFAMPDAYHTFRRGHRVMVQVQSSCSRSSIATRRHLSTSPRRTEADFKKRRTASTARPAGRRRLTVRSSRRCEAISARTQWSAPPLERASAPHARVEAERGLLAAPHPPPPALPPPLSVLPLPPPPSTPPPPLPHLPSRNSSSHLPLPSRAVALAKAGRTHPHD